MESAGSVCGAGAGFLAWYFGLDGLALTAGSRRDRLQQQTTQGPRPHPDLPDLPPAAQAPGGVRRASPELPAVRKR